MSTRYVGYIIGAIGVTLVCVTIKHFYSSDFSPLMLTVLDAVPFVAILLVAIAPRD